jgi:cytochrome c oxidase cbb3-type subunit 4
MFGLSFEELREIQAYAYFFFTLFLVIILYGYIYHLFKAERTGTRNYEQYGKLALDDELDSTPLESREEDKVNKKEN